MGGEGLKINLVMQRYQTKEITITLRIHLKELKNMAKAGSEISGVYRRKMYNGRKDSFLHPPLLQFLLFFKPACLNTELFQKQDFLRANFSEALSLVALVG